MTERKPIGVSFETWVDRQIREAAERGAFDDLPGAGKPLPGQGEAHDDMWWIKRKLQEENLSFPLPASLALRKEAEEALAAVARARSEDEVRAIVADINHKIIEGTRKAMSGPPLNLMPYDVEEIVQQWRDGHPAPPAPALPPRSEARPKRRSLLRWLHGRAGR
ncbi:DUF1992 domain-containing protein [Sphaerisporangium melleum]|uniref:DUF1992 domain-containing protein n=1 Tax=Sphaerisporangium melleum TaxID=321316 RepID=A0A917RPZ4_9ACTN|nr:DUF1992 domain-containing protein [Sphaerisporangium melleum]GGL17988.1 DUF1992 domain-containing protein [Sphaerisporangium melleum]GII73095.1 DUF1992 domain-containing protein [Sphaerisporangium melleum]